MTSIKPRTARVVIYQGDDLARLSELDEAVARAEEAVKRVEREPARPRMMHEADLAVPARAALVKARADRDEFAAEAEVRGVAVHLHALPRRTWRSLMRDHGAREGDEGDKVLGVNMETLPDALLPLSIDAAASGIDGGLDEFLDSLADFDYYDRLFLQAFALNRGSAPADPTRRLLSAGSPTSGETSTSPSVADSAPSTTS